MKKYFVILACLSLSLSGLAQTDTIANTSLMVTNPPSYPGGVDVDVNFTTSWARDFSVTHSGMNKLVCIGAYCNGTTLNYGYIGGNNTTTPWISPWVTLLPSGNVGFGTTSPQQKVDVSGTMIAGGAYVNSNTTKMMVRNTAGKVWALSSGENNVNETNFGIYDWTDNTANPYLSITTGGNVLIGKVSQVNSTYMLDVAGNVRANELVVNTTGADFVFDPTYALPSLNGVSDYIAHNRHLPGIEPAATMAAEGIKIGENQTKLLQKIEELTLYVIQADKRASQQDTLLAQFQAQLKAQQVEIDRLKARQGAQP